jgi:septum formation protein
MSFPTISKEYPLILASASPRRKRLLEQVALPFLSMPSSVEEDQIVGEKSMPPHLLAEKKARAISSKSNNNWILGADTIVVFEEIKLGKPRSNDEARSMLHLLAGKEHTVTTGFCLIDPSGRVAHSEEITTLVKMKELNRVEIEAYIATGEPFDKAGSYAIQGIGSFMVETICGSYTNVVGLPVHALIKSLLCTGALERFPIS